ncbi:MAG: ABC transporter permease [Pseudomonadales bacterium]|nr:ABC transporter permease [Pseudomonadales bacterium]MCP5182352.1 ABC transporter permease [Pseudomonadales bacterium]
MSHRPAPRALSPLAIVLSALLLLLVTYVVAGPWLVDFGPEDVDWDALESPPDARHWFGTDLVGRDLFTRIAHGGRLSLTIALTATLISVLIGVPYGAIAGYLGGRLDQVMMRFVDTLYSLPFVLVVILLVMVVGRNTYVLFAALGAVYWLDIARIVRGQALRVRHAAFVEAARAMGATTPWIVWRHVVPNVSGPALVYATLTVPGIILAESFLSFLGLGVQEPQASWGVLVADGAGNLESAPWTLLIPGTFLSVTVWSLNLLGDRLRDALDVRAR